jgi:hypothetical protein
MSTAWSVQQMTPAVWSVHSLIVNLPAWFKNESEKANAGQSHHGERYEKCLHDLCSKKYLIAEWICLPVQ